ncbi:hypothetical protein E2C01_003414 [Portunus trituberculatus]|uniref:Uncharacterized protein n=1 Tax=Portunus trituberculatus TaxID=210409 RepID=A0A5B7CNN3_PORTR|nr:hypothetical protein [Portunus trituberculatus]
MVVTRKRSCSASETSTLHKLKARKEDEGGGSDGTTVTTRSSARGVVGSGTGTSTICTTPRRTRRYTDSIAEAATSTPRTLRTRQGRSAEGSVSDKSESSNDEVAEKIDSPSQPGRTRNGRNKVEGLSTKQKRRSGGDKTVCVDSPLPSLTSKLVVRLKDITPSISQSPRSRRLSRGDKNSNDTPSGTPSTPVRRSRRLSGSRVEDVSDKETPSKKSFTIARILGMEEEAKEETSKASVLPVIEEDTEHLESNHSPKKDTREAQVSEENQMEEEEKLELKLESDNNDLMSDNDSLPSDTAATKQEAEIEVQAIVSQPVVADECDGKKLDNHNLISNNDSLPSDTAATKQKVEIEVQTIGDQPVVADECVNKDVLVENVSDYVSKEVPVEKEAQEKTSSEAMETTDIASTTDVADIKTSNNTAMKSEGEQDAVNECNSKEAHEKTSSEAMEITDIVTTDVIDIETSNNTTMKSEGEQDAASEYNSKEVPVKKEAHEKTGSEAMETTDIASTTDVIDIETSNNTAMKSEGEQDAVLSSEDPNCKSTKVKQSNDSQESKTESTSLPNVIQERTEDSLPCSGIHTTSNISDENGNSAVSAKMNGVSGLPSDMAGGKKVTKVIPELEKKINQLRSVPKGRPISGRWWKAEKQR